MQPFDFTLEDAHRAAVHWRKMADERRARAEWAINPLRRDELLASAAEYDDMAARAEGLTQEQLTVAKTVWDAVRQGEYTTLKEAADVLDPPIESSC